jgi:hypothetical protein
MDALVQAGHAAAAPGRACPLSYRYSPSCFDREADFHTQTLYVAGGLYGNLQALSAIEALFTQEAGVAGFSKHLVFNGDFHWFDTDPQLFAELQQRVLRYVALRGNVETEIAHDDADAGCGCAYPSDVDDGTVARSNLILARLRDTARADVAARESLARLPMHAVAQVGPARIGIVHGDAQSLAGWQFDARSLDDPAQQHWLADVFDAARVDVFASSHTCAPALRVLEHQRAVINNGAAGMASTPHASHGILTRIGSSSAPADFPVLASARIANVHVQALAVRFDDIAWQRQFLAMWPPGSAAYQSYWQRIVHGPAQDSLHAAVDHHSCS